MAMHITNLAEVEELVAQLPPNQQLRLAEKINGRLAHLSPSELQKEEENFRREHAARVEEFMKRLDEHAVECTGPVDSAEDIRQIREERASRL